MIILDYTRASQTTLTTHEHLCSSFSIFDKPWHHLWPSLITFNKSWTSLTLLNMCSSLNVLNYPWPSFSIHIPWKMLEIICDHPRESFFILDHPSPSYAIFCHLWPFFNILGNPWPWQTITDHTVTSLNILDHPFLSLTIHCQSMSITEHHLP